ncbi:hypothetical protein MMC07_001347 [Pseudocyphellaria aurata]|nr:hypothetical protein [Pseudocyphellaria aurata]
MSGELIISTQAPTTRKRSASPRTSRPSPTTSRLPTGRRTSRSGFTTTKRDKRTIKHSALISRIEKSKPSSKKRRRPSKKLITNLESLAEALPHVCEEKNGETVIGDARINHKSLKSRPGALKKKETLISMEKERFNKNMAQMVQYNNNANDSAEALNIASDMNHGTGRRWAAIRSFIQQQMERRPESSAGQDR